jgi:hypothetical protein
VKALALRIGLYRVAAILVGCALALEVLRVEVLSGSRAGAIAVTVGEIAFLASAAGVFMLARRRSARR